MTFIQTVIADYEANSQGIIDTICLIACSFETKSRLHHGIVTRSGAGGIKINIRESKIHSIVTIKLTDVIIKISASDHIDKKHGRDMRGCITTKSPLKFMKFNDGIDFMCKFIHENGNRLIMHSLHNDLENLMKTQQFIGSKRFELNQHMFPSTGPLRDVILQCSYSIINNRCPLFIESYRPHCKTFTTQKGGLSTTLQSLVQFAKNDYTYIQSHSALQDTLDLFEVLQKVHQLEGEIPFTGGNYMKIEVTINQPAIPQVCHDINPIISYGPYAGHRLSVLIRDPKNRLQNIKNNNYHHVYPSLLQYLTPS